MTTVVGGPNGTTSNTSSLTSPVSIPELDFADGGGVITDVRPAWGESLPAWANDLIAMLSAGQAWPEGSESQLWELARAHKKLVEIAYGGVDPLGAAAVTLRDGWQAPSFMSFAGRLESEYSQDNGLLAAAGNHLAYALQADGFARDTQHTKISINIAFWIALIAAAIALTAAFFSAGATTSFIGPIAAASRARMMALMAQLTGRAGVPAMTRALTMGTKLASSTSLTARMLRNPFGREIIEELGEELFIEVGTQLEQMRRGTRRDFDWKRILAAGVGAGAGAVIGMKLGRPVASLVDRLPLIRGLNRAAGDAPGILNAFRRFPGRVLNTGLNNVFASGGGGFLANGLVYQQWELPTGESLLGAAMGGAGRTNTISPFNPDVISAVTSPVTALAEAQQRSEIADAYGRTPPGTQPQPSPTSSTGGDTPSSGVGGQTGTGDSNTAVNRTPANVPSSRVSVPDGTSTRPTVQQLAENDTTRTRPSQETAEEQQEKKQQHGDQQNRTNRTPQPQTSPTPTSPVAAQQPGTFTTNQNSGTSTQQNTQQQTSTQQNTQQQQAKGSSQPSGPQTAEAQQQSPDVQQGSEAQQQSPDVQQGSEAQQQSPDAQQGSEAQQSPDGQVPDPQQEVRSEQEQQNTATAQSNTGTVELGTRETPRPVSPVVASTVDDTLRTIAADVIFLRDGKGALLTLPDGRIARLSADELNAVKARLDQRLQEGVDESRLAAEAAVWLGVRISEKVEDALPVSVVLDTLGRLADTAPDHQDAAVTVAQEILEDNPGGWRPEELGEAGTRLLETVTWRGERVDRAMWPQHTADNASEILRQAKALAVAPLATPAQEDTPSQQEGTTETGRRGRARRGTATMLPVEGSAAVNGRRAPHLDDLSPQEVRDAIKQVLPADFGTVVQSLTWVNDRTLRVELNGHPPQHFRFEIGPIRSHMVRVRRGEGAEARTVFTRLRPLAKTEFRAGTESRPHRVRLAPRLAEEVLPRTWVHEISHAIQRLTEPGPGVFRRLLTGDPERNLDRCLTARINEHRHLSRKWHEASEAERPKIRHELVKLAEELERQGHTPPAQPWSPYGVLPPTAPDPVADLQQRVRDQIESLAKIEQGLQERVDAREESRKNSLAEVRKAEEKAEEAKQQKDALAKWRIRDAEADAAVHRANAAHHEAMKTAYRRARQRATSARKAYERLEQKLAALTPEERAKPLPADVVKSARRAERLYKRYETILEAVSLSPRVLSAGMPDGRLPHMRKLTQEVNDLLARNGVEHRYTVDELLRAMRQNFRRIVSEDGATLRLEAGKSAELRIRLHLGHLVEVLGLPAEAAETILAQLPQDGAPIGATATHTYGRKITIDPIKVLKKLPPGFLDALPGNDKLAAFLAILDAMGAGNVLPGGLSLSPVLRAEIGRAVREATNETIANTGLGGAVENNRGAHTPWMSNKASWTVDLVTGSGRRETVVVDTGLDGDATTLTLWMPSVYERAKPGNIARLPQEEWGKTESGEKAPFPEHMVTSMEGLHDLFEKVMQKLPRHNEVGDFVRDQIANVIKKDLPSHHIEAVNRERGYERPIVVGGKKVGSITIKTTVLPETAQMFGTPSNKYHRERLRIEVSEASGGQSSSSTRSYGATAGVEVGVPTEMVEEHTPVEGRAAKPGLTVPAFARSTTNGASMASGSKVFHVNVQRSSGYEQGYTMREEHTVTIEIGGVQATVTGKGSVLLRMAEAEAYRYGLPVDAAAIQRDEQGKRGRDRNARLRDDPVIDGDAKLPSWMGGGKSQDASQNESQSQEQGRSQDEGTLRGVGDDGQVRMSTQAEHVAAFNEIVKNAITKLADENLPLESEKPSGEFGTSKLKQISRQFIERILEEQTTARRLEAGYTRAVQVGIPVPLKELGIGHAPRDHSVRARLEPIIAQPGEGDQPTYKYLGVTRADTSVNLTISSATSVYSTERSQSGGSLQGANLGLGAPVTGLEGDQEVVGIQSGDLGGRRTPGRSLKQSRGNTVNFVTLTEGTAGVAKFLVPHRLVFETLGPDGVKLLAEGTVWMEIHLPADSVSTPENGDRAPHQTSSESWELSTVIHTDIPVVDAVIAQLGLPLGSTAYHHMAEAFETYHLTANPEALAYFERSGNDPGKFDWLKTAYGTEVAVEPRGVAPTTYKAWIRGFPGDSEFIGVRKAVNGRINMTMSSAGVTRGQSVAYSGNLGAKGGDHQAEGSQDETFSVSGGFSGSRNTSTEESSLDISARERLNIGAGNMYEFKTRVDVEVAVAEQSEMPGGRLLSGKPKSRMVTGYVRRRISEHDALALYAEEKLDLPLHVLTDAMERYLNGSLQLNYLVAPRLVERYLQKLEAVRNEQGTLDPLAAEHTMSKLVARIQQDFPRRLTTNGNEQERLAEIVQLADTPMKVQLPETYADLPGDAQIKRARFTEKPAEPGGERRKTTLYQALVDAVKKVSPSAVKWDSTLWTALRNEFVGMRWVGKEDNMLEPGGFASVRRVRVGPYAYENLVIRVKAVPTGDEVISLGPEHDTALGEQDYRYRENTRKKSSGGDHGGSTSGSTGNHTPAGDGVGTVDGSAGSSTGLSHSVSVSTLEQGTRISGTFLSIGGHTVRQKYHYIIEVERQPEGIREHLAQVDEKTRGVVDVAPPMKVRTVLEAEVDRTLPDGMVAEEGKIADRPSLPPDPRRVRLPHMIAIKGSVIDSPGSSSSEGNANTSEEQSLEPNALVKAVMERLRQRDLLGKDADKHALTVEQELSGNARNSKLIDMSGAQGDRSIRLAEPDKDVYVWVEARFSDPELIARLEETQIRDVDRTQNQTHVSVSRGHLLPVNTSVNGDGSSYGLGGGYQFGEQASQNQTLTGGTRIEASLYKKGPGVDERVRVRYDVRFEVRDPDGKLIREVRMPGAATGHVIVSMFEHDHDQMIAERNGPARPRWQLTPTQSAAPAQKVVERKYEWLKFWAKERSESSENLAQTMAQEVREDLKGRSLRIITPAAEPGEQNVMINQVRQVARDLGVDVEIDLVDKGSNSRRRYIATPDGELYGDAFAEAFASLPAEVLEAAGRRNVDLRTIFDDGGPDGFPARVRQRLEDLGERLPEPRKPDWPVPEIAADASRTVTETGLGSVTNRNIPHTAAVADGRAPHLPDLSYDEIPAALADLEPKDLGGRAEWNAAERTMVVHSGRHGAQHFKIYTGPIEELPEHVRKRIFGQLRERVLWKFGKRVPGDLPSATGIGLGGPEDPHLLWISPRIASLEEGESLPRALIHEVNDVLNKRERMMAPPFRSLLTELTPGHDLCAEARIKEFHYLSRKWEAATDPDERARLRHELEGLKHDLALRGKPAPLPPWQTELPRPRPESVWERMRRLSNPSGWEDLEEDKCICPPGEPCVCGRRREERKNGAQEGNEPENGRRNGRMSVEEIILAATRIGDGGR